MGVRLLNYLFHMGKSAELSPIIMTAESKDLKSFLITRGIERLTQQEMQKISHEFSQHFRAGLKNEPSSLATLPSHLSIHPLGKKDVGRESLVIGMGGTNLYAAEVTISETTQGIAPVITSYLAQTYENTSKKFDSAESFFSEAASVAKKITKKSISSLGVIWSFPGNAEVTSKGVDQRSMYLSKGFVIPAIEKAPIGEQVLEALGERGLDSKNSTTIAVLNDTVGVVLAEGGGIGGVIGTGFNLGVVYNGQIYNLEPGGFTGVPETFLSKAIDIIDNPGIHLAEKQVSGKYIGMQLDTVTTWLSDQGLIPGVQRKTADRLQSEHLSALLSGDKVKIEEVLTGLTDTSFSVLQNVAEILRDRSAQIAGTIIGTLINETADQLPNDIVIPIEGSFFAKTPGYQEAIEKAVHAILGDEVISSKHISFKSVEQSGIKGAAVAALTVKE